MKFSYKLTDVNKEVYEEILNNPAAIEELKALNELWNKVSENGNLGAAA